ncbi:UNVERIFIED_CONTAM: Nif3-like dinuclear metal center hexameric protein [Campylobacter lari]
MQIRKVTKFLLEKYPLERKEIWDSSGFSVKFNQSEKITGVVLAIDLTKKVLDKAIEQNANLIVTHHPFKFESTWESEDLKAPYKREILNILKQKRIHVLSFHTNYDNDEEGTSYEIATQLGLEKFRVPYEQNYPCLLNYKTTPNKIIELIKTKLHFKSFRTNLPKEYLNSEISKIAILSGSGYITEVNALSLAGYDLIITSDIK